jgi:hypothetical protein
MTLLTQRGLAIAVVVSLSTGCSEDDIRAKQAPQEVFVARVPPQVPAQPRPPLQFTPDDLSTGARLAQATLLVPRKVSPVEEATLRSALRLVRWPSREVIEATVHFEQQDLKAGSIVSRFTMVSKVPFESGWYAAGVELSALPAELVADLDVSRSPWPGHLATRFATHLVTAVTDVGLEETADATEVTVKFSARVRDSRLGHAVVQVLTQDRRSAVPCQSIRDDDLHREEGTYRVALRCPLGLSGRLAVVPDLRSLTGVPVGDAYGGPLDVALAGDRATRLAALGEAIRF